MYGVRDLFQFPILGFKTIFFYFLYLVLFPCDLATLLLQKIKVANGDSKKRKNKTAITEGQFSTWKESSPYCFMQITFGMTFYHN